VAEVRAHGDPARGEAIYRRADLACLKCHAIAGVGGQVGPSMESIGASAQDDYLVESILNPGKAVKEGYHAIVVATNDGQVITGIKIRQDDQQMVLRDADGKELAVPLATVEEQKEAGSIMPAGLVDSLTRAELVDLVRFLSALGEVGPYASGQSRALRRWQTLEPTAGSLTALTRTRVDTVVTDDPRLAWLPAYATVSGALPLADLPEMNPWYGAPKTSFARTQLDVTTPGKARLRLNSPAGLGAWLDQTKLPMGETIELDLPQGVRTLTFVIDRSVRTDDLRVELEDVAGSGAKVQPVVGK
jgi:putative heme-binding domain-containing protein